MQTVRQLALAQLRTVRPEIAAHPDVSLACKDGIYLKYQWQFRAAPEDKPFARRIWWTHVKFCRQCREEWHELNRLAQLPATEAWKALEADPCK